MGLGDVVCAVFILDDDVNVVDIIDSLNQADCCSSKYNGYYKNRANHCHYYHAITANLLQTVKDIN